MDTATMEREERASALDAFARPSEPAIQNALTIPGAAFAAPAERSFGAINVAVHRDETRVLQKLKALAAAAGDDWYYRFPVKKKDGGKDWIEGASIKLANDLARLYGNCEIDTRVMDLGDSWLIYARFTDYETGFALTRPFQQRKAQRAMKTDADRALDIAFQIGVSKAIRNVVTNALQTFSDFAFDEAKHALVDKIGKRLDEYRARTKDRLAARLDVKRVEAVIGRVADEWLAPDIARIIAMMKAVDDGMASLDETFPPLAPAEPTEEPKPDTKLDDFAAKNTTESAAPTGDADGAGAPTNNEANAAFIAASCNIVRDLLAPAPAGEAPDTLDQFCSEVRGVLREREAMYEASAPAPPSPDAEMLEALRKQVEAIKGFVTGDRTTHDWPLSATSHRCFIADRCDEALALVGKAEAARQGGGNG